MHSIRIKIKDLFESIDSDASPTSFLNEAIAARLEETMPFLPRPFSYTVDGDDIVLSYEGNTAKEEEAQRLAAKAEKRAKQGEYDKAVSILLSALKLDPMLHSARRNLAMTYMELGETDNAINHLIEVLRLDPSDTWSWIVLGNLYIKQKFDHETGEKFLKRALSLNPDETYALNSLAALRMESKDYSEAIKLFDQSMASNPLYPNPYYGKALTLTKVNLYEESESLLEQLFAKITKQDVRQDIVFDQARELYVQIQQSLAEQNQLIAASNVNSFVAEIESLSGFPTSIEEREFEDLTGATIQSAWKYHQNHHLLLTRKGYSPVLLSHLEIHELTHIKLESEARSAGKNKFFTITARSQENAIRTFSADLKRFEKEGYTKEWANGLAKTLVDGLAGFLFNCPLDMIIERKIRSEFPALKHAQFLSLRQLAEEARNVNNDPMLRKFTPKKIMLASLALNGAYALFLDDLFQGATEFASPFVNEESFMTSQRLYDHWLSRSIFLPPGAEYQLIDEFADILGLSQFYEWKDDPMYEAGSEQSQQPSGVINEPLLEAKAPAAVFYLVAALKRFESMSLDEIQKIGFEIALLGAEGIDYTNANKRYNLRNLPAEQFTGLQLMTLMYVAWQKFAPVKDIGINFYEEYKTALQLYESGKTN